MGRHWDGLIKETAKLPSLDGFGAWAEAKALIFLSVYYLPKSTKGGLHYSA